MPNLVMRAASAGSIPAIQCMPRIAYKCTAHCNRVLPCADLGTAARVGKGHSSNWAATLRRNVCGRVGSSRHKIRARLRNQLGSFLFGMVVVGSRWSSGSPKIATSVESHVLRKRRANMGHPAPALPFSQSASHGVFPKCCARLFRVPRPSSAYTRESGHLRELLSGCLGTFPSRRSG